ncbi:MAG TPA: protein-export chaperone SecB [Casimicrobiaceae bacterium]|nr:protein-export chaperone SecB [Casimicrobiaceae bacterium]
MGEGMTAQMSIERIYVKDLSLENPGSPQSFQMTEAPQIEVGLRTRAEQVAPDIYECVVTLTVTARAGDKTVFLVEASQAGVFGIRGIPPDQLQPVLAIHCPTVIFPYARETVADATMRAGFPPVQLAPINFEALYQQQLAQAAQPAAVGH